MQDADRDPSEDVRLAPNDPEFREFMAAGGAPVDVVFGERLRRRLRAVFAPSYWKSTIAAACEVTGVNAAGLRVQQLLLSPCARAVNYHDVPPSRAAAFEAQLRFFAEHYVPVGPADLAALHAGRWPHPKPGLLLSFDDGLRSHADVVAPLLEKYGFSGWFNVPPGFVDAPVTDQVRYAREHRIALDASAYPDGRVAMSWRELQRLDGPHEICCHTYTHRRLEAGLDAATLSLEIDEAKRRLEEGLGHAVRAFCWVGGEEWAYSAEAAARIRAAGFEYSFMTNNAPIRPHGDLLQIQRTQIEADFAPELVRLSLSGLYDLFYLPKRRRVNRLTAARAA